MVGQLVIRAGSTSPGETQTYVVWVENIEIDTDVV